VGVTDLRLRPDSDHVGLGDRDVVTVAEIVLECGFCDSDAETDLLSYPCESESVEECT
jgi:hypothetical protein